MDFIHLIHMKQEFRQFRELSAPSQKSPILFQFLQSTDSGILLPISLPYFAFTSSCDFMTTLFFYLMPMNLLSVVFNFSVFFSFYSQQEMLILSFPGIQARRLEQGIALYGEEQSVISYPGLLGLPSFPHRKEFQEQVNIEVRQLLLGNKQRAQKFVKIHAQEKTRLSRAERTQNINLNKGDERDICLGIMCLAARLQAASHATHAPISLPRQFMCILSELPFTKSSARVVAKGGFCFVLSNNIFI